MKPTGMDSRVPAPDRAYTMILALLDGVVFTRAQLHEIKRRARIGEERRSSLQRRVSDLPCRRIQ